MLLRMWRNKLLCFQTCVWWWWTGLKVVRFLSDKMWKGTTGMEDIKIRRSCPILYFHLPLSSSPESTDDSRACSPADMTLALSAWHQLDKAHINNLRHKYDFHVSRPPFEYSISSPQAPCSFFLFRHFTLVGWNGTGQELLPSLPLSPFLLLLLTCNHQYYCSCRMIKSER